MSLKKINPVTNPPNYKAFDGFIQECLDKYFLVEPWKKLYEKTGELHREIISDKSKNIFNNYKR